MELFDPQTTPRAPALKKAISALSETSETERGAVFTRRVVVEAILDLAGYTTDRPLHRLRLLEPSFGNGDFLLPALERLLAAYAAAGGTPEDARQHLSRALRGVELNADSVAHTRRAVAGRLAAWGLKEADAIGLTEDWLREDDFLLTGLSGSFDGVVGNPPYVRQERIPGALLQEYRRRYATVYDRADLYVPFYERGLKLLAPGGRLAFICSDRWMKNKYGGPLRALVASGFHLVHSVDMVGTDAFTSEVVAYPAITVIERGEGSVTRVVRRPPLSELSQLARAMENGGPATDARVEELTEVVRDRDPWLLDAAAELRLVRDLEARLPTLEGAGCKVGIGVATGADRVFTGPYDDLPVEPERKLPLAMPADLQGGGVRWGGKGVVNPFEPDGELASFERYPQFAAYIQQHAERLKRRHVAKRSGPRWYRTIDRIWPALVGTPKLLIPDIKGAAEVSYDEGRYYPHHNLYYVTAEDWDLRALQAVLRSSVALLFVNAYCIKMSGGFLRFQAQYLRRIRLPRWSALAPPLRSALAELACSTDQAALDAVVYRAYGLDASAAMVITEAAERARGGR
ncbi:MAG: Eco57I restriction-modification methylase domain-containing protein [Alphaproteobacteria bacterium]|nr:Eco57I restriction-modification methylase domain-containing protein [Alphaproteobacteria bacterium]